MWLMKAFKSKFDGILAEYIWIDGIGELRSKIKVLDSGFFSAENMPVWNFDGSSTKQGSTENSEVVLRPVQVYKDPFHKGGLLVLCETYIQDDAGMIHPHPSNMRYKSQAIFKYSNYYKPWYGIEQEYFILESDTKKPFKNDDPPKAQGKYYCGTDPSYVKGRSFAEEHLHACLYAGLKMSGMNAKVGPSQWEYQIGPVEGIEAADQLWVSRYILQRLAEEKVDISFHPKPIGEDWAGSGCHTNFSTIQMRMPGGYTAILDSIENLRATHKEFIQVCGEDSNKRLTGDHETAMISTFNWGIASRNTSVRIPKETYIKQCGYFEDRRPSANMDPYRVCSHLLSSVIPKGEKGTS